MIPPIPTIDASVKVDLVPGCIVKDGHPPSLPWKVNTTLRLQQIFTEALLQEGQGS